MKLKYIGFIIIFYGSLSFANNQIGNWIDTIKDKKILRFDDSIIGSLLRKAQEETAIKFSGVEKKFLIIEDSRFFLEGFNRISSIDEIDLSDIKDALFLVFFQTDDDYFYVLKKIKDNGGVFYSLPYFGPKTRYVWTDKCALRAIDKTFSFGTRISHQNIDVHEIICLCLNATKHLEGDYVEVGVYMGGSALTALHYMTFANISRKSYFMDTFNGMTYDEAYTSPDILWQNTHILWGPEKTMNYVRDLLNTTHENFTLVRSNICYDALPKEIEKIAVCNIDVDLYDATLSSLEKIAPLVVKGGIIICEDPTSTPTLGGALLAMEEFLLSIEGQKFFKILVGGQYLLIKMNV